MKQGPNITPKSKDNRQSESPENSTDSPQNNFHFHIEPFKRRNQEKTVTHGKGESVALQIDPPSSVFSISGHQFVSKHEKISPGKELQA